jgi:predicted MFS family arabinose efflux permease
MSTFVPAVIGSAAVFTSMLGHRVSRRTLRALEVLAAVSVALCILALANLPPLEFPSYAT